MTLPFALLPYFWGLAAWFVGGLWVFAATVRATWPRGMRRRGDIALYALAVPAVYANAVTGQTGTWMAAIFGGGLMAIERRPMLAGALLGLLSAKPQMALLVPVALLSARRWTALIAFSAVCAVLTAATAWLFGIDVWGDFAGRVSLVRRSVLEAGIGLDTDVTTWNIFISVFVMIRALPASVAVAYAVQGAAGLIAVSLVIAAWRSAGPQNAKNAVLVMAAFFATPYVQLYDLVVATLVPLWLVLSVPADDARQTAAWLAAIPLLLAPLAAPALYRLTGYATGCLWLVPAFAVAVRSCLRCARPGRYSSAACPDGISASSIRLRIWRKPRPVP